jgi:hypothetical protein
VWGSPGLDLCARLWERGCRRGWTTAPDGVRRRHHAAAAAGATAPMSAAVPAACWDAEGLACGSKEGAVSSEDRGVGLGVELVDGGQGTPAARPG